MSSSRVVTTLARAVFAWGLATGCKPFGNDEAPADGGEARDISSDASTRDASDTSTPDAAPPGPVAAFKCGSAEVASCGACQTEPAPVVACVYCTANGYVGRCIGDARHSSCSDNTSREPGWNMCPCVDATQCPGDAQVCGRDGCTACGEELSDGLKCKLSGVCNKAKGLCE